MACGLPVLCSDDQVVSEPVVNYSTGLFCHRMLTNENVTDEIVENMETLFNDDKLLSEMSKNASDYIKIKHDWKILAKQFEYFFNTLIDGRYK